MSEDLDAWITGRAKEVASACRVTRECAESIIARAMREAVEMAYAIDAGVERLRLIDEEPIRVSIRRRRNITVIPVPDLPGKEEIPE